MPDDFTAAYIECALWSSNDESDDSGGEPMDKNRGPDDIAPESAARMSSDCDKFREQAGALLDAIDPSQAGHDFWLTRSRHGTGFWDRGLGDMGDKLTALAHSFGECSLYIGDDELIYC